MTKSDLKTGMIVKYRNSKIRMVMKDTSHPEKDVLIGSDGWMPLYEYTEDLRCTGSVVAMDIMYVYEVPSLIYIFTNFTNICRLDDNYIDRYGVVIWEREEPVVEMTIKEIEEKLGIKNLRIK